MFTKTSIVISVAVALASVSGAMAATKHPVHHLSGARVNPAARSYGFVAPGAGYPSTMDPAVLDALRRQAAGDPRCWGGNCDPTWNSPSE